MVRPSPVPPNRLVVELSAWLNASKIVACFSRGTPMPVSLTRKCSLAHPSARASSRISTSTWPRSVNLMPLPIRFPSTWRTRTGSPTIAAGMAESRSQRSSIPFSSAFSDIVLSRSFTMAASENGIASSSSRRDSIFEKSRMSLRIESSDSPDDRTVVRQSRCSAVSAVSSTSPVIPRMPFMGVRISWLMFARNSLLARLASTAESRALTRSALEARSSLVRASTVRSSSSWCCSSLRSRS